MYKTVAIDFDGVIADSEPAHFLALQRILRDEGITLDWEDYRRNYLTYDDRN